MSDDFVPCAVIPTYDNPQTVGATVAAVREHLADVILVDDGSGPEGRAACDRLAADGHVVLERRPGNGGKGAAVKTGFAAARGRGFTHAFQVDADGQHDIGAMPQFLAAARADPRAFVIGHPVYDETVPRSRLLARRITSFWVALELGGTDRVRDAMVGFRVYPLAATLGALARGNHMDFDIEIAVRLARAGTPIVNLPVRVRYVPEQEGGVSHFQPFRDNLRFFGMHGRLCMGGLLRWARRGLGAKR